MCKRALRRSFKEQKIKRIAKDRLKFYQYATEPPDAYWEVVEFDAHYKVDNRKDCSCWMCRNGRKTFGPSLKELSQNLLTIDEKEQLGNLRYKLLIGRKGCWR